MTVDSVETNKNIPKKKAKRRPPRFQVATVMKMVGDGRESRGYFLENEGQLGTVLKAGQKLMGLSEEQMTTQMREYIT